MSMTVNFFKFARICEYYLFLSIEKPSSSSVNLYVNALFFIFIPLIIGMADFFIDIYEHFNNLWNNVPI